MFIDTDRKNFEIFFPESLGLSGMGRDDDLGHFRFFRIIREELRLIEDLIEGQLDRSNPEREAEEEIQRQKEKRTVPVGVCNDRIQGITQVVQSPTAQ
mgnify:CR=1 FL=1